MTRQVAVVDLFSGPGGLAEGFAALPSADRQCNFNIALSVEMNDAAHRTLCLRNFLRKFPVAFPTEYYDFLNGDLTQEPEWSKLYEQEWEEAYNETLCLKLGTVEANTVVQRRVKQIRANHGDKTVLLGGPPCQPYSVVGRARNVGNAKYDAAKDERQSLYKEYARILTELQPSVAVMENVKGMLSARHLDSSIFPEVMRSLANAGGKNRYRLFPLCSTNENRTWDEGLSPRDFLVRTEQHGIPQKRHRVFVICVRQDVAASLPQQLLPNLESSESAVSVYDIIGTMPKLRSRLSTGDAGASWKTAVVDAYELIQNYRPTMTGDQEALFVQALNNVLEVSQGNLPPTNNANGGTRLADACPDAMSEWIFDAKLKRLPNHETRGHIRQDIARYLFATAFAAASARSPRASDFPAALAPKHASWNTGKFDDRFRVQLGDQPSTTITSHISKDGHYFIHPDATQCRSLTVREAARLQTFPDNYYFHGARTQQYVQVGNAVPPYLALLIAGQVRKILEHHFHSTDPAIYSTSNFPVPSRSE